MHDFTWSAPAGLELEDATYTFDGQGKLRNKKDGKAFEFVDQAHYDRLGDKVLEYIQRALVTKYNLRLVRLPLDATADEPTSNIFVSGDLETNAAKLLFIQQGTGAVRAGQWARALCINDSLKTGTIFPYIEQAVAQGYSLVITNPNLNRAPSASDPKGAPKKIRGSEKAEAHTLYVWDHIVSKSPARDVYLVAHSYGGICTVALLSERTDQVKERVRAIALTDSVHHIPPTMSSKAKKLFEKLAVNWVASSKPLDAETPHHRDSGCRCISAGHSKHEYTSECCRESVFRFFQEHHN
eukprot:tig00001265_g7906.t1